MEYREHDSKTSGNFRVMLSSSIKVVRGQRVAVQGDARAERALRHGLRHWQERYGEPSWTPVRGHWRDRNWKRAAAGANALLLLPSIRIPEHASRKLRRVALGQRPESLDTTG